MLEQKRTVQFGTGDLPQNFTTTEFQPDENDGSTGGLGSKQFIKLPKHYEPSMFGAR